MEESLGQVIVDRRQELGMSQRELAKSIHISNSTISRIESDFGMAADISTIRGLAETLKLDYNYLLALNGVVDDEPEIRKIQRAFKYMSQNEKEVMLQLFSIHFRRAYLKAGEDKREE